MPSSSNQSPTSETAVTRRVARWLARSGWTVLAVHYPGSQAGTYIHSTQRRGRGAAGAYIPDIIAITEGAGLIIESKTRFSSADVAKLGAILHSPEHRASVYSVLGVGATASLQLLAGIALPTARFHHTLPDGFVVFLVTPGGVCVRGTLSPDDACALFPGYTLL